MLLNQRYEMGMRLFTVRGIELEKYDTTDKDHGHDGGDQDTQEPGSDE